MLGKLQSKHKKKSRAALVITIMVSVAEWMQIEGGLQGGCGAATV
jgi:hypothetical protein